MLRRTDHAPRFYVSVCFGLPMALALAPVQTFAATTPCSTVAACVMGTNTKSGVGVGGTSSSGFGISGISKSSHGFNGTSASSFGVVGMTTENASTPNTARAGVYGEDESTNKGIYNSGVAGLSLYGIGTLGETRRASRSKAWPSAAERSSRNQSTVASASTAMPTRVRACTGTRTGRRAIATARALERIREIAPRSSASRMATVVAACTYARTRMATS
jgi:hypothetical protein